MSAWIDITEPLPILPWDDEDVQVVVAECRPGGFRCQATGFLNDDSWRMGPLAQKLPDHLRMTHWKPLDPMPEARSRQP